MKSIKPLAAALLSLALATPALAQKDAYAKMRDEMALEYVGHSLRDYVEEASPSALCEVHRLSDTSLARAAWQECVDVRKGLVVSYFGLVHAAFGFLMASNEKAGALYNTWALRTGEGEEQDYLAPITGAYRDFLDWFMESVAYADTLPLTNAQKKAVVDYAAAYKDFTLDWYFAPSGNHADKAKKAQDAGTHLVRALQPRDAKKRLKELPSVEEYQRLRKERAE